MLAMDTDQLMFVEEKETKEREPCVCENKVKSIPFQHIHRGNGTGFVGVHKGKKGKFGAQIRDPINKKKVWLGTFNTAEEASNAYLLKKQEFLAALQSVNKPFKGFNFSMDVNKGKQPISCEESSCLMASVHSTKSSHRCIYTVANHPKAKRSLLGIQRRKNGWTGNVATDLVRCKKVWLTTSETKSCDQIEPESPVGASSLSVDNDQTVDAASVGTRNNRIDSHKTTRIIGVYKKNSRSRYTSEIRNPINQKRIWLGSFDTAEEASQAYQFKKLEFQKLVQAEQQCVSNNHTSARADQDGKEKLVKVNSRKEPIVCAEYSKEASSLVANVHGTESSDGCIYSTVTSNPEAKRNLLRIRRQNDWRYAARIADPIRHEKVWLGTSDTVVEDSEAYFSKKSDHEKLSKGNKENTTKNCDQTQPESPVGPSLSIDEDQTLSTAFLGTENNRIDSHRTTHIVGVHKRKSGIYTSEIRNPISKKRIWLGCFVTAEEASQAYQSKKLEFQKLVEAKQQRNRRTHSSARAKQDGKEKLVNVKQGQETVNREGFQPESSYGASGSLEIEVPTSNSSNGGIDQSIESHEISHSLEVHMRKSEKCTEILLGTLGTAEEALNAYQCKKPDLERSKKAELQDTMPTDSSAGTNRKGQEDEDLWMGQWVQLPGNREIKFSLKLGVPIIDNYGCLLGEFSSLDDLRIC